MNYVYQGFSQMAGYMMVNINNIYNFIIYLIELIPEEQHENVFRHMKLNIGVTFHNNFKYYASRKGYKYD